jgi:curved DNA-binding protein CbpA
VETLYDRLGVPRDVDEDGLRAAWRRIARTLHPDVGGDKAAFQELQKAYDVLSHANTRAFYDLALDTYRPGASIQPVPVLAAGPPPEWTSLVQSPTVLPERRRGSWRRTEAAPVEEPTGRHESGVQASGRRRTPGSGKRSGSTWKRMRAVSVETTRS